MKRIRKGQEPAELATWRSDLRPRSAIPSWTDFSEPPRGAVRARLVADQHQLCCYCTASVVSGSYHIEHFKPRGTYQRLTYAWTNLLASCHSYSRDTFNGVPVPAQLHCGEAKGDWFLQGVTVDPQSSAVEDQFRWPLSGKVFPNKSLAASRRAAVAATIDKLNLNAPSLVARRGAVLELAGGHVGEMAHDDWCGRYLALRDDGSYQEFWPAIRYNYLKFWLDKFPEA